MATNTLAIRKRAQIAKANRTMFLWIAASSVIIGASIVVSIFFAQNLIYNQKVISAKNKTVSTLRNNNKAVPKLEAAVRVLDTNPALASIKANPTDQTLQVVLDALPSDANSLALGASLQTKLLANIDGLRLTSLQVTPVAGIEATSTTKTDTTAKKSTAATVNTAKEVKFQFAVTGSQDSLKQVLVNLQKSLRIIDVESLTISTAESGRLTLVVNGRSFFVPAKTITLTDEVVKR
jgi:hypothetical protein